MHPFASGRHPMDMGAAAEVPTGNIRKARALIWERWSTQMSRLQKKVQAVTKQTVGQMIGDDRLIEEGREQERHADEERQDAHALAERDEAPRRNH
jgi:uncharacterized protein YjbJ (UPF0337 family)